MAANIAIEKKLNISSGVYTGETKTKEFVSYDYGNVHVLYMLSMWIFFSNDWVNLVCCCKCIP